MKQKKNYIFIYMTIYETAPFFFFLRPEEHGVNLILGFFDIRIPERFQKLVKCGVVLGWHLDTDEDFADVYQKSKEFSFFGQERYERGRDAPAPWFL